MSDVRCQASERRDFTPTPYRGLMDMSLQTGARALSRGLRTGSPGIAGLGALLLALAVIRRDKPRRTLVYRTTLGPGQFLRVGLVKPESAPPPSP